MVQCILVSDVYISACVIGIDQSYSAQSNVEVTTWDFPNSNVLLLASV